MKKLLFWFVVLSIVLAVLVACSSSTQAQASETAVGSALCRKHDLALLQPANSPRPRDVVHLTSWRMRYENLFWDEMGFDVPYRLIQCNGAKVTLKLFWHDWLGEGHHSVIGQGDDYIEAGTYGFHWKWRKR